MIENREFLQVLQIVVLGSKWRNVPVNTFCYGSYAFVH